jgi:excisionase family DNA binding protein
VNELLSTTQAAARLGITPRQVQRLIEKGHLPGQKVGYSYVVQAADLEQFERRPVGRPRKGGGE